MKKVEVKAVNNVKPMNKATKERHEFNQVMKNINTTFANIESFVSAVSVLFTAGVTFWYSYTKGYQIQYAREVGMFLSLYIGLKGAHLFFNHINHKR